jgi:Uncharacterized protein conserved in bacteria (DUF2188)/Phasin protein
MAANGRFEQREQRELLDQWSQTTRKTFELFQELGDINANFFGRFSRRQLELASAFMEAGTKQLQLFTQPGAEYYRSLLDAQSSLITDYNNKFGEIARESTSIVSEATERLTDWVQQGASTLERNAQTAARGFERAAERTAESVDEGVERVTRVMGRAAARGAATLGVAQSANGEAEEPTFNVIPRDDGWAVQLAGASRATSVHSTKEEAVERARALAADRAPSQLVVHKKDGTVQDTISYPA